MTDSFFLSLASAAFVAGLTAYITTTLTKWADRMRLKAIEIALAELEALTTREMKRRAARERWAEQPATEDLAAALAEDVKAPHQPWWRKHGSKAQ